MTTAEAVPRIAIPVLWAAWIGYWVIAARNTKRTRWQEPPRSGALHGLPLALCVALFAVPLVLTGRFAPAGPVLPLVGTVLVASGLGFAIWARVHLGRNWSSRVVVKEDHALIRAGPYRWVRHPIYSGLLLALGGVALAIGEWRGVLGFVLAVIGIAFRIRAEETQMRRTFPEYARYERETKALIPGLI